MHTHKWSSLGQSDGQSECPYVLHVIHLMYIPSTLPRVGRGAEDRSHGH